MHLLVSFHGHPQRLKQSQRTCLAVANPWRSDAQGALDELDHIVS